jgi:2-hydroxy-3-keto-5-methylthiopentenyl-1-phosphate phosphatase
VASISHHRSPTLIVDWDGTITERDSLLMVLEQFGDWEECERLGVELFAGKITLRQEIERQFGTVTAPLDEVVEWVVDNVRVRPGLPELAALHPLVVSSGFHELIDPVLAREGVSVELQANRIEARPDGWRPVWRELPVCSVCGQPCKRSSFPPNGKVIYVGDGYSDRCGALAADRIFARRGLADYLDGLGTPYERFDDLNTIVQALEGSR